MERIEEEIADRATAARTIAELGAEIASLKHLEELALRVRQASTDRKWDKLSRLLQDEDPPSLRRLDARRGYLG